MYVMCEVTRYEVNGMVCVYLQICIYYTAIAKYVSTKRNVLYSYVKIVSM